MTVADAGVQRFTQHGPVMLMARLALQCDKPTLAPGWRVRILNGNHLGASELRIEPLRG
ncbi:hypothetical protein [Azohydromonas aeria]|uniref:hypothetical protein n=1 Tax=Azohydromonas aeria TaxID=2590212 RepID=UPI0012FC7FA7|nr:hypothetical protein [Azohydromonas aeria]